MFKGLSGKHAIVTGGSTLIGAGLVEAFVKAGATVTIADIDAELVGTIGKRTFRLDGDCEFSAGWMQGSFPIHVEVSK